MRFDKDRAEALSKYAIYTILEKAMDEDDAFCISLPRSAITQAMKQTNLFETHEDFITDICAKVGVAYSYLAGIYYFFMPNRVEIVDASKVLGPVTDEYAKLSRSGRQEMWEQSGCYPLIDDIKKQSNRKPSGRKKAA